MDMRILPLVTSYVLGCEMERPLQDFHAGVLCQVCTEIDGVDDASMLEDYFALQKGSYLCSWQEAADCMDGLGFSKEEKNSVFQIVAAAPRPNFFQTFQTLIASRACSRCCTWVICSSRTANFPS